MFLLARATRIENYDSPADLPDLLEGDPAGDHPELVLFPFCSERCRQVDLLRWSQGKYAIVEPLDPRQLDSELPDVEE